MSDARPEVTIVDPNAPSGTTDLLSSGRDPWRPSRRQVLLATSVVVLLAALLGVVALALRHVQAVRNDRKAVRSLSFQASSQLDQTSPDLPSLPVELLDTSDYPATVLDVRFDAPGFAEVTLGSSVAAHLRLFFDMPKDSACDDSLYAGAPSALVVHARTARGTPVTRRVPLDREVRDSIWPLLRAKCHFLLPEDSLNNLITAVSREGSTFVLRYRLENAAALPLVLDRITAAAGVEVAAQRMPVTVPAGSGDYVTFGHASLVLRLRVTDCRALRDEVTRSAGGDGFDGPSTLKVVLHHAHARGRSWLQLTQPLGENRERDLFTELLGPCG